MSTISAAPTLAQSTCTGISANSTSSIVGALSRANWAGVGSYYTSTINANTPYDVKAAVIAQLAPSLATDDYTLQLTGSIGESVPLPELVTLMNGIIETCCKGNENSLTCLVSGAVKSASSATLILSAK